MLIIKIGLDEYEPWSGAKYTYNKLQELNKLEDFEELMSEMYPEGVTETKLNDILWFEDEWIFDTLGIETEE